MRKRILPYTFRARAGATLVEVMIGAAILSIGILGFILAFTSMTRAIQKAKTRTLSATPLTMEKLEILKKTSYNRLMVSTYTLTAPAEQGGFLYDGAAYPEEAVTVGDITFIRRAYVEKVEKVGNEFQHLAFTGSDTGIKRVTAYTLWQEDGEWKKYEASSLLYNPNHATLESQLAGNVQDEYGADLENVRLTLQENSQYTTLTDSGGDYSFKVPAGSYTLRASKTGYTPAYSASVVSVPDGAVVSGQDFTLAEIGTGTISGLVWVSTHMVVSGVVCETNTYIGSGWYQPVEFIELFNPTTYTITVFDGASAQLEVNYYHEGGVGSSKLNSQFSFTYEKTSVPSRTYYLLANATYFYYQGRYIHPDAYYKHGSYPNLVYDYLDDERAGAIELVRAGDGSIRDTFGWNDQDDTAPRYESAPEPNPFGGDGMGVGAFLIRLGYYNSVGWGHAYDMGDNEEDLIRYNPGTTFWWPRTTLDGAQTTIAGMPAFDAVVSADDGLSSSTQAVTTACSGGRQCTRFTLTGVATGTWTVYLQKDEYHFEVSNVVVTHNAVTEVPNATTVPPWPWNTYNVSRLSCTIDAGFISGTVEDTSGAGLPGIVVKASGGSATTAANGTYVLSTDPGTHSVEVNPTYDPGYNADYVYTSEENVSVSAGQITTGVDFTLNQGGSVYGWITVNGFDPLPNIPITATRSGVEYGSALSGVDGYYYITNLASGTYSIAPETDVGESVVGTDSGVSTKTVTLADSDTLIFSDTFTLTGALGTFTGEVTFDSEPIETGVLIIATTGTISGAMPETNDSTFRTGTTLFFATSSDSSGHFSLQVRGNAGTYNVYAWYPGGSPWKKTISGKTVDAGGTEDIGTFSW